MPAPGTVDDVDLIWQETADDAVPALLRAARDADGTPEIDDDGPLPREFRDGRHLLARDGDTLVGYAHVDQKGDAFGNQIVELIVHPAHRRAGHGAAMVDAVLAGTDRPLRLWSHRDHPGAARIAEHRGLTRVRELFQMHLGPEVEVPEPTWRDGVGVRAFVPGRDEQAMVEVNKRAFDWHPEQGMLTVADVEAAERESWFDASGFFLAVQDERVVGFHWTKVHADGTGEVYVVGVDPDAQGGGLGKALTLAGLRHLRKRGVRDIILYVESDNSPAVAVYTRLGFTLAHTNAAYQR